MHVSAAAAFGDYSMKTNRDVALSGGDEYNASFNAQSYRARLESGYIALSPLTLTPYAALQVQDFEAPSYSETAVHWSESLCPELQLAERDGHPVRTGRPGGQDLRHARRQCGQAVWTARLGA
jgi:Autotransporter beta-domain